MTRNTLYSVKAGLLLTALLATSQPIYAAAGKTAVTVNFPEIIILHYRSGLDITFTGKADTAIEEEASSIIIPLASAGGDGELTASGTADTTIPVKVKNMWAVRGITSSGSIQIDAEILEDTATTGSSSATMSKLEAITGAASGSSIKVTSNGIAMANAIYGGIAFDLDITNVNQTGSHTGIVYTITASAP